MSSVATNECVKEENFTSKRIENKEIKCRTIRSKFNIIHKCFEEHKAEAYPELKE